MRTRSLRRPAIHRYDHFLRSPWYVALVVGLACAPAGGLARIDRADAIPANAERHYEIWFGGARVGSALETEVWNRDGVAFRRVETMRFLRGDVPVGIVTTIEIAADRGLAPSHVDWTMVTGSNEVRHGEATRDPYRGWIAHVGEDTIEIADPAAIPAELAPLLVQARGRFSGPVFLPARGFVVGIGRIEPILGGRLIARLTLASGPVVEATIDLDRDHTYARVVDGDGVIALRATATETGRPYSLVDLIEVASVPITGTHRTGVGLSLAIDDDLTLPALPGQRLRAGRVELSARFPGELPPGPRGVDRAGEIAMLVRAVRGRVAPDLGTGPTSSRDALTATSGDCTTFALAYHALATSRSIPTHVVTGLRIDGDHLVRHRWAVSWTGRSWIAVDAAFGQAPAGGALLGVAVHEGDDAGLVAGEAALAHVHGARW